MLTDAKGTEFDPSIHNIINDTLKPQLSKAGNFVKLQKGKTNGDELIEVFIQSLKNTEEWIEPEALVEGATDVQPAAQPDVKSTKAEAINPKELADTLGANLVSVEGAFATLKKNGHSVMADITAFRGMQHAVTTFRQNGIN